MRIPTRSIIHVTRIVGIITLRYILFLSRVPKTIRRTIKFCQSPKLDLKYPIKEYSKTEQKGLSNREKRQEQDKDALVEEVVILGSIHDLKGGGGISDINQLDQS